MKDWESIFKSWAKAPSDNEEDKCKNAICAVQNSINSSKKLQDRNIQVFLQGSYKNKVNVRQDSDVDLGVICKTTFFTDYPEGTNGSTFGNDTSDYTFKQFKDEVEKELVVKFDRQIVTRGNKSFDIKSNSYRIEADVTPFFEHRKYNRDGSYIKSVALKSDNNDELIINYPEQHYNNGVTKNTGCNKKYKSLVRILKKMSNEMEDKDIEAAKVIPGFLCECLVWNVPDNCFNVDDLYTERLKKCLLYLYTHLNKESSDEWTEVSKLKYLFSKSQKWTKQQSINFIVAVYRYIGFKE